MQRKKETRPESLQAKGRAHKSTNSLSQREWERKWDEIAPATFAVTLFFFTFLALGEAGVIL